MPKPDLKAAIRDYLEREIVLGFHPLAEIEANALDLFGSDEAFPGDHFVSQALRSALQAYRVMRLESADRGDAERLDAAFAALEEVGIFGRHYYGATRGDANASIAREEHAAWRMGRSIRGYAFYTMEDADQIPEGSLPLVWGSFSRPGIPYSRVEAEALAIGEEIVLAMKKEGLDVAWDGTPQQRILLRELDWRAPREPGTDAPILRYGEQLDEASAPSSDGRAIEGQAIEGRAIEERVDDDEPWGADGYPLTPEGEWLLRVAFVGLYGIAHAANLRRLWEGMDQERFIRGEEPPFDLDPSRAYGYEFVSKVLSEVEGRAIRFDAVAATMSPYSRLWQELALSAHCLVLTVCAPRDVDEALALLGRDLAERLPPLLVQLEGEAWDDEAIDAMEARFGADRVLLTDIIEDGTGTFDTFKRAARITLTDLKATVKKG